MKRCLRVTLALLLVSLLLTACRQSPPESGPKAAIIDQLYILKPNPEFIASVKHSLERAGFKVDVFQGREVTVDFYRRLPERGYKLLLFRSHSGILGIPSGAEINMTEGTWLFTAEPYNKLKYPAEQMTKQMGMARVDSTQPWLFAIGADFVELSMRGEFTGAIVIMLGCSSLQLEDLAKAFIEKGALAYIGWSATVDASHADESILALVQKLVSERLTVGEAVNRTTAEKGLDPTWGAKLGYYPVGGSSQTIVEVIGGGQ